MEDKKYTLEDVESLRGKTGISYEEAVGLLEKYDGDITRALIELEKRGELGERGIRINVNSNAVDLLHKLWRKGSETRLIVERDGERLVNLSVLFMVLALILGWRLIIVAALLALALGCRVRLCSPEEKPETVAAPEPEPVKEAEPEKKPDEGFNSITIE